MQAQATGAQQISDAISQSSEATEQTADSRQSNQAVEQMVGAAGSLHLPSADSPCTRRRPETHRRCTRESARWNPTT